MARLHAIGFVAPRAAWLLGHVGGWVRRTLALLLLIAALSACALAAWQWWDARAALQARQQAIDASIAAARRSAPVVVAAPAAPLIGAAERTRVNRVVRSLNTPWATIFESLERAGSPRVALVSIEPDVERGAVRVQTEGPSLDELLRHAEAAQVARAFAHARLLRIETAEGSAPGLARLSFDLVLSR